MAEETVINYFLYSITADFDKMEDVLADIEAHKINLENEEEAYEKGNYMQSYTIYDISTLGEEEYGEANPLYYYEWEEIIKKYNLIEYEIINVTFSQIHSQKSIELGPQWGNGRFSRSFIVGKNTYDNNYKIYDFGIMQDFIEIAK